MYSLNLRNSFLLLTLYLKFQIMSPCITYSIHQRNTVSSWIHIYNASFKTLYTIYTFRNKPKIKRPHPIYYYLPGTTPGSFILKKRRITKHNTRMSVIPAALLTTKRQKGNTYTCTNTVLLNSGAVPGKLASTY